MLVGGWAGGHESIVQITHFQGTFKTCSFQAGYSWGFFELTAACKKLRIYESDFCLACKKQEFDFMTAEKSSNSSKTNQFKTQESTIAIVKNAGKT